MRSRSCRWRLRVALAALALAPAAAGRNRAQADIVHLQNGKTLEGTVTPGTAPGTLEVATGEGTRIVLKEAEVLRVEKRASPAEEVEARLKGMPAGELEPLVELLGFARGKSLPGKARLVARRILEIDPNHEAARKELGFVVFQNRWIQEAELKKRKGLVQHHGEWMSAADKARREVEERRREIEELLDCLDGGNAHVQEYAVRQLLALREPVARQVFASRLRDPHDGVRWVAVRALHGFPVSGEGDAEARRAASDLHQAFLAEKSEKSLEVYVRTLRRFFPRESFRLALETIASSTKADDRQRAARILQQLLIKAWVPELCRVITRTDGTSNEEVRGVLREAFGVDLGQHPAAWLRYWEENQGRFRDE